jgi:transposase InsO family protein
VKRDFKASQVNQKWFGDHTEIATDEGKPQLASVLDVASRRIAGFSLSENHDASNAYGALAMAVAVRGGAVPGVILHTDQGSEGRIQLIVATPRCRRWSDGGWTASAGGSSVSGSDAVAGTADSCLA